MLSDIEKEFRFFEHGLSALGIKYDSGALETLEQYRKAIVEWNQKVNLVISDINMPDMNGLAFLRELGRKHPSTNVIMITAYGGVESYLEAMNLGAFEYLHKPIRLDELRSVMKKIFNGGLSDTRFSS